MKRYRFTTFIIDSTRSLLKVSVPHLEEQRQQDIDRLRSRFGELDFDAKLERYLELDSPNVTVITEYYWVLNEAADAYACGYFYPALTSACCLGERILNILILNLREYYKTTPSYKKVWNKDSFQNWDEAIDVLAEWGVLADTLAELYKELWKIRKDAIHLKAVSDFQPQALKAIQYIMKITGNLFGLNERNDIFFWVPGEPYIRKEEENEPLVKEFFIPNCTLVGYKYSVRSGPQPGLFIYDDPYEYEDREITDDEFKKLRESWRSKQ